MKSLAITTPVKHLQAIYSFAAEQDVRYYLNAVAINDGYLVATNGLYLGALPVSNSGNTNIIIPGDIVKLFLKGLNAKEKREDDVTITVGESWNSLRSGCLEIPFKPVDGTYPDWKRLIPKIDTPVFHPFFNWAQVALFQKAAKILGGIKYADDVHLIQNGSYTAQIYLPRHSDFIGFLMPMRIK